MRISIMLAVALAISFAIVPSSYAWGIAYGNTEIMAKEGEHISFYSSLQNMEEKTYEIAINIAEGKEIAAVSESQITLQPNTKHTIYVEIDIPENAEETYDILVSYVVKGTGSIQLSEEKQIPIHIIVSEQTSNQPEQPKAKPSETSGTKQNVQQNNKITETNNETEKDNEITAPIIQQPKPIPAVPPEKQNETKTEEKEPDNTWLWIAAIIIIIAIIAYLWWSGWI